MAPPPESGLLVIAVVAGLGYLIGRDRRQQEEVQERAEFDKEMRGLDRDAQIKIERSKDKMYDADGVPLWRQKKPPERSDPD